MSRAVLNIIGVIIICAAVIPVVAVVAYLMLSRPAGAGPNMVRDIDWLTQPAKDFVIVDVPPGVNVPFARVTNAEAKPRTVTVLTVHTPVLATEAYAITGQVRYQNVEGDGYLEMWSVFPDGGRYFTRTLASQGPTAKLRGTHGWRRFSLPFYSRGSTRRPIKLVVNVVLPGRGTVELGAMQLVQFQPGEDALGEPGQWAGGLVGGLLGGLLGVLGAAIGVLCSTGRHRRLVMGLLWAGIICGLGTLAAGLVAIAVWPSVSAVLIFAGSLATLVFMPLRTVVRRRYDEAELRRMSAQDTA